MVCGGDPTRDIVVSCLEGFKDRTVSSGVWYVVVTRRTNVLVRGMQV